MKENKLKFLYFIQKRAAMEKFRSIFVAGFIAITASYSNTVLSNNTTLQSDSSVSTVRKNEYIVVYTVLSKNSSLIIPSGHLKNIPLDIQDLRTAIVNTFDDIEDARNFHFKLVTFDPLAPDQYTWGDSISKARAAARYGFHLGGPRETLFFLFTAETTSNAVFENIACVVDITPIDNGEGVLQGLKSLFTGNTKSIEIDASFLELKDCKNSAVQLDDRITMSLYKTDYQNHLVVSPHFRKNPIP